MCIDILEKEEIITYREKEHDLLMEIRNGKFLNENNQPTDGFYDLLNEWQKKFEYAKENTSLQKKPDYKKVEELLIYINKEAIKNY